VSDTAATLAAAFDRICDFQAVQAGAGKEELQQAVGLLQESVCINDDERVLLCERLEDVGGFDGHHGHVLLGLILGLMAAQA
jgi:hypothetical protein